jgi:hypothetical protein
MAHELLCKWLELPSNPWPPDHYALLGLNAGSGDADVIEQRVLERMESLRHYQLLHPEVVTEGMNLLAQAMISLTDPSARDQYDRDLGVDSSVTEREIAVDEDEVEDADVEDDEEMPESMSIATLPEPPANARILTWPNEAATTSESSGQSDSEEPPADPITILELDDEPDAHDEVEDDGPSLKVPSVILEEEEAREADLARDIRRRRYRDIVRLRRVIEVWEKLRTFLEKPAKTFSRRTDTVAFMNSLSDLRPLLGDVSELIGDPNEPGHLIAALAKQQLVVEMFRSLLPSQREALADDCQSAFAILTKHYRRLRRDVRRLTARGFKRRFVYPLYRSIARRPEWLFLCVGIAALAIAFVRSVPK